MYKKFYAEKNIDIKEYIAIVISVLVIIISVVLIIGSLKRKNYILRAEEVRQEKLRKQEELKQSEVDKVKTAEEEKLEKIRAEDKRLGLTSTAQKERDNFIYNKNIQTDIDKIYSSDKKEVY